MSVARRIGHEYLAQGFAFAVTLFDRVILTGLLVRLLGVEGFAGWSIALAAAGLVALFDFGFNLYFANRIMIAVERRKPLRARHAHRAGNLLMIAASILSAALLTFGFGLTSDTWIIGGDVTDTIVAAGLLIAGMAMRMATSVHLSIYRAHQRFARQSVLQGIGDLARALGALAGAIATGDLLGASIGFCAGALLGHIVLPLVDANRLFPAFPFVLTKPDRAERRSIGPVSLGYWLQSAPTTLLTLLPVFIIAAFNVSAALLAQFVLMRTISNFVRAGLQLFGIVLGQEAARRFAQRDQAGLALVLRESGRALAIQAAGATAFVLALGEPLFALWTGGAVAFDMAMLLWAVLPMLFGPVLILAHNFFATANRPWPIALGRGLQLGLTLLLFLFLPIEDAGLRMMAALALGEIFGFGIPVARSLVRLVPEVGVASIAEQSLRGLIAALLVFAACRGLYWLIGGGWAGLLIASAGGGAVLVLALLFLGITAGRRRALLAALPHRRRRSTT